MNTITTGSQNFETIIVGCALARKIAFAVGELARDQLEDTAADADVEFNEWTSLDDLRAAVIEAAHVQRGIKITVKDEEGIGYATYGFIAKTCDGPVSPLSELPVGSLFVNDLAGKFVAKIVFHDKNAQTYRPEEPWLLLFNTGRTDHFVSQKAAKIEASKTWVKCSFEKSAI